MEKEKVARYIDRERLFMPADKVLVALSGGADSVALLCLLQALGYDCEAAHCNFHLRGEESDRDEAFVRRLCAERKVPLHTVHFDTRRVAGEKHISIEMARVSCVTNGSGRYGRRAAPVSLPWRITGTIVWRHSC